MAVEVSRTVPERKPETVTVESEPVARGEITIRLKTAWLQNIAAVAAVVLLFFLMSPDAKNTGVSSASQAEFARLMWMPAVQETVPEAFNKLEEIQVKGSGTGVESPVSAAVQPETVQKAAVSVAVESGFASWWPVPYRKRTRKRMSNGFIRKVTKRRKYIKKEIWCVWFSGICIRSGSACQDERFE